MITTLSAYIWYCLILILLWLPLAAAIAGTACMAYSPLRRYSHHLWLMSLGAIFCGLWSLWPSFFAATGHATDNKLLFQSSIGVFPAAILHGLFGIISGCLFGRLAVRATMRLSKRRVTLFSMFSSVPIAFLAYVPPAAFEHALAGGSGYGEGVPRLFMVLFESMHFPSFRRMQEADVSLALPGTYAPMFLWIIGACAACYWIIRKLPRILRRRSAF